MLLDLKHVWGQAIRDHRSANLDNPSELARIRNGIKIVHRDDSYLIYNTSLKGDYYQELNSKEYLSFQENGWEVGCYLIIKENYLSRLDRIEFRIREEINYKKSMKTICRLKTERDKVMNKYVNIIFKINKSRNGNNKIKLPKANRD